MDSTSLATATTLNCAARFSSLAFGDLPLEIKLRPAIRLIIYDAHQLPSRIPGGIKFDSIGIGYDLVLPPRGSTRVPIKDSQSNGHHHRQPQHVADGETEHSGRRPCYYFLV